MLSEEDHLEPVTSEEDNSQKSITEDESREGSVSLTEVSSSEPVDSILSGADETITADNETVVEEVSEEKVVDNEENNESKQETEEETVKLEPTITKPNRELKLLLELSKEANLDTNIAYKRKSVDPNKNVEHQDHKYASTPLSDGKRSMRSQNPEFVVKQQKFLSKVASDSESLVMSDTEDKNGKDKLQKKKENFTIGGAIDEKTRKLLKPVMALIQNNKDGFCWRCHREGINISCETCPRSFHLKCLKHSNVNIEQWVCPECVMILNAENTKTRSPALKDMSLEQLCGLLKFALKRMAQCNDSDPFLRPVNEIEFPDYKKYIVQPMDLSKMQRNIRDNLYGSTNAFEADAKWLLHNSIIFNSYQSKLTTVAKSILKVCKQEMSEIENCPNCYLNANTKKDWFVDVCPKPHLLLWAKLKGFPYWPAKAMSTNSQGMVDVRFFGAHDRAWVPFKECFLYSLKDPNPHKQMKNDIIECIKELDIHIDNLRKVYGEYNYAPYRTPYDPENEVQQLQLLLPTYKPAYHTSPPRKFLKIDTLLKRKTTSDKQPLEKWWKAPPESVTSEKSEGDSKEMEGYGTDEEMDTDGDIDTQSEGRIKAIPRQVSGGSRLSSDDLQRSRRNSEQSTKSDASRLSSISDKISTVDISENMEVSLGNDEINIKLSDNSDTTEIKRTVEHQNKLKISDKLMKKLSGTHNNQADIEMDVDENEDNKVHSSEDLENNTIESESQPTINDINKVILGCPLDRVQILKINPNSKSPVEIHHYSAEKTETETPKEMRVNSPNSEREPVKMQVTSTTKINETVNNSSNKVSSTTSELHKNGNTVCNEDKVSDSQNADDLLEEMYSEAVDVSGMSRNEHNENVERLSYVKSTNKRKRPDEIETSETNPVQNKFIKLVDINIIKKSQGAESTLTTSAISILKTCLATTQTNITNHNNNNNNNNHNTQKEQNTENGVPPTVEIKSEPNSDAENEKEDIEAKKHYLSALNISEKLTNTIKPNEKEIRMKTRTDFNKLIEKSSEIRNKKATEPVEVNESNKESLPRLIKQLPPKQRARKTFPRSSTSSPMPITKNDSLKVTKIINSTPPAKSTPLESQTNSNVVILTQPQSVVNSLTVLPPNQTIAYTTNMGNPILTMVQPATFGNFIVPTSALNPVPPLNPISDRGISNIVPPQSDSQSTLSVNGIIAPANTIFTSSAQQHNSSNIITFTTSVTTPISSTASSSSGNLNTVTILNGQTTVPVVTAGKSTSTDTNEDLSYLSGCIPENISKSLSDLMHRAPPRLKPRPPGPLSNSYDPGLPSSAGRVTSVINSVAHKLSDYFRGMLIETLNDLGSGENSEALVTSLRLENEKLKHKHTEEIAEIKKNVNSILRDIQKSIIDERERVIEETKAACELETIRRVEEAKSKQWCANCMKEAQFYCCWNTSYCDYPCQLKHWPKHMSKCSQNINTSQSDGSNMAKLVTPLILRKTSAPKTFTNKPVVSKSNKEVLNKASLNKGSMGTVKTPAVSAVTIVDHKQRSFEVKNSVPVSSPLSGKILNFSKIKPSSKVTTSISNNSTGMLTSTSQKYIVTQSK